MVVALNSEQAQVIDRAIEAGLVSDAEDAIELGVASIRLRLASAQVGANRLSDEEWLKRLQAWVDRERPDAPLLSDEDISRESIYGDRGL